MTQAIETPQKPKKKGLFTSGGRLELDVMKEHFLALSEILGGYIDSETEAFNPSYETCKYFLRSYVENEFNRLETYLDTYENGEVCHGN